MGRVQWFERRLQSLVGDAFARLFGGNVVPQELAQALQREAEDGARPMAGGRVLAPDRYIVTLGATDYDQLVSDEQRVIRLLQDCVRQHVDEFGWDTYGDVVVTLERSRSETLHTGQFRTSSSSSVDPDAARQMVAQPRTAGDEAMSQQPGHYPEHERRGHHSHQAGGQQGGGQHGGSGYDQGQGGYDQGQGGYDQGQGGYDQGQGGYGADQGYDQQYGYDPSYDPSYGGRQAGPGPAGYNQNYNPAYRQGYGEQGHSGTPAPGYDQGYGYDPNYAQGQPPPEGYNQQYGYDQGGRYDQGYGQGGYGYDPSYAQGQQAPGQSYDQNYGQYGGAHSGYGYQQAGYDQGGYDQAGYEQAGYEQAGYEHGGAAPGYRDPNYPGPAGYPADRAAQGYMPPAVATGARQLVASLVLDDGSNRHYQLVNGSNVIGRGQDAQFRLPDTGVSRRHLEITWDGQVAMLADLGSTNGTTVNGTPVQTWQLADGDVVRVGHSSLIFHLQS